MMYMNVVRKIEDAYNRCQPLELSADEVVVLQELMELGLVALEARQQDARPLPSQRLFASFPDC